MTMWQAIKCKLNPYETSTETKASFMWVSSALNRLPHRHYLWHVNALRRERRIDPSKITNSSIRVMKLNFYETVEWNFVLGMDVSFHLCDVTILKITQWNSWLRMAQEPFH